IERTVDDEPDFLDGHADRFHRAGPVEDEVALPHFAADADAADLDVAAEPGRRDFRARGKGQLQLLATTLDDEGNRAFRRRRNDALHVLEAADGVAVYGNELVPRLQPGDCGRGF